MSTTESVAISSAVNVDQEVEAVPEVLVETITADRTAGTTELGAEKTGQIGECE